MSYITLDFIKDTKIKSNLTDIEFRDNLEVLGADPNYPTQFSYIFFPSLLFTYLCIGILFYSTLLRVLLGNFFPTKTELALRISAIGVLSCSFILLAENGPLLLDQLGRVNDVGVMSTPPLPTLEEVTPPLPQTEVFEETSWDWSCGEGDTETKEKIPVSTRDFGVNTDQ